MRTLIIEDETIAAQNLTRHIAQIDSSIEVLAVLQSIEETIDWFGQHPEPDLVFLDIHLADGNAFKIFDSITINCPIIFTTAYDQYALQAFKVNSIDYLLKPINQTDLSNALEKYNKLNTTNTDSIKRLVNMIQSLKQDETTYKSFFLIPQGANLKPLPVRDIACIYLEQKLTVILTMDGQRHLIDKPLDSIMQSLDPAIFFRANRQYIVAHDAIKNIGIWFGNKLDIKLSVPTPDHIVVSKARVMEFKTWFTK